MQCFSKLLLLRLQVNRTNSGNSKSNVREAKKSGLISLDAEAKILGYAATLGIDVNKMKQTWLLLEIKTRVERDMKEAVSIGLQGEHHRLLSTVRESQIFREDRFCRSVSAYLDAELAK